MLAAVLISQNLKFYKMIILQLEIEELTKLIENIVRKVVNETYSQKPQQEPEIIFTIQEAAKFLSLSVPTIYGLISKREIPVMKRSKRCYFLKSELIDYLKEGRHKTVTDIEDAAAKYLNAVDEKITKYKNWNDLSIGDKVVFKKVKTKYLTEGKEYDVVNVSREWARQYYGSYWIIDDRGHTKGLSKNANGYIVMVLNGC